MFLAAVVATSHFSLYVLQPIDKQAAAKINYLVFGFDAAHAVLLFYLISGFLISYALEHKYGDNIFEFYKSRFLRIFPLFWTLYGVMALFDYADSRPDIMNLSLVEWLPGVLLFGSDWAICFTHYPAEYWAELPPFLRPAWSLGAELTFYAMAPFLLWRYPKLCLAAFVGSAALRGAMVYQFDYHPIWTLHFFPTTLFFFLLGHYSRLIYRWIGHHLGAFNFLWLLLFLVPPALVANAEQPFDGTVFYLTLIGLVLALPYVFERTKDSRVLNFLGDLSYPLYLSHLITLSMLQHIPSMAPAIMGTGPPTLFMWLTVGKRFVAYTALFMACALVASAVLHHCVEGPLAAIGRRLLRRPRWVPAPVAAAPALPLPLSPD